MELGKLFIVATPIGNPKDITLRALDVLEKADIIICEEFRAGSTLLKKIGIANKELLPFNENNEDDQLPSIINLLIQDKKTLALISDHGTPVFADPGHKLIRQASQLEIPIIPIPGPSSLMAAFSMLDFKLDKFIFGGFLPRNDRDRNRQLNQLKSYKMPVVIMDTPYRLLKLLDSVQQVFGKKTRITLACDLTQSQEMVYRGAVSEVKRSLIKKKAEFILIIHNR